MITDDKKHTEFSKFYKKKNIFDLKLFPPTRIKKKKKKHILPYRSNSMADLNGLSTSLNGLKAMMETDRDTLPVDETDHQARLEQELEQIRQVNDMTEGVIESLKVTELNLDVRLLKSFCLFNIIII